VINQKIRETLKKNWGERADTLNCYAEVRLYDPLSSWCCYIFAMDEDEEEVKCLLYSDPMELEMYNGSLKDILSMYNEEGEHPIIDHEFRRIRLNNLIRRLKNDTR
jgi:hypothetical protein